MKTKLLLLQLGALGAAAVACAPTSVQQFPDDTGADSDSDSDADADTDTDTDGDGDTDADTDTDTDADSDTDTDADADSDADSECADPVTGAPTVTSGASVQLAMTATSGAYTLSFSEDVVGVSADTVTWTATSGGSGTLDSVSAVDAASYELSFSGVAWGETYDIVVAAEVADTCGNALAAPFTVSVGWAPLACPLPNSYATGVPFTGTYDTDEYCSAGYPSYHLWDLSGLGARTICLEGTYYTESCCDTFYVRDGASSTVYSIAGSGSFAEVVNDDQAITCVESDYSINYDGYTVTAVSWF